MGDDTPVAVLSCRNRSIYDYFRQSFAQVTNPPIDPLRESAVMSLETCIGREHNVFHETASHAYRVLLPWPVLNYVKYQTLLGLDQRYYRNVRFSLNYDPESLDLRQALEDLAEYCMTAVQGGATLIVLSDRDISRDKVPMPAPWLLARCTRVCLRRVNAPMPISSSKPDPPETRTSSLSCSGWGQLRYTPTSLFRALTATGNRRPGR